MNIKSLSIVFVATLILAIGALSIAPDLLLLASGGVIATGTVLGMCILASSQFYTGVLFTFHVLMFGVVTYCYTERDNVIRSSYFDFSVFTEKNLETAVLLCLYALVSIFVTWLTIGPSSRSLLKESPVDVIERMIGRLVRISPSQATGLLALSLAFSLIVLVTNTSVVQQRYPENLRSCWVPHADIFKIPISMAFLAFASIHWRVIAVGRSSPQLLFSRLSVICVATLTVLVTGSRGFYFVVLLMCASIEIYLWLKKRNSVHWCIVFLLAAYLMFDTWPHLRSRLHSRPTISLVREEIVNSFTFEISDRRASDRDQFKVEDISMLGMSTFHLLSTIELIDRNISLKGSTFVNLVPQALPSFLEPIFGKRPRNDNWKINDYYRSQGGFLVIANAYWNGGAWVMIAFMVTISAIFLFFDRNLAKPTVGAIYKWAYFVNIPVMFVQLTYGIQGLVRVIEIVLLCLLVDWFSKRRVNPSYE
ncbi:hypothetical protein SH528x_005910 [Novipirellula sp. SH528]|uniref:hypothetical protein n=1 Tax=Novipirellula sp. SH528 TaxID=3454466 RepID=UPI003F9FEA84